MLLKKKTHITFIDQVEGNSPNSVWSKTLSLLFYMVTGTPPVRKKIKKNSNIIVDGVRVLVVGCDGRPCMW
jgi:hypothetical protein